MKKWLIIGLVFVVLGLLVLSLGSAASERRARFINMANDLLEAHLEHFNLLHSRKKAQKSQKHWTFSSVLRLQFYLICSRASALRRIH